MFRRPHLAATLIETMDSSSSPSDDHRHDDPNPKRRRTTDDDAGGDRLSALPDELLVDILERVDSRAAVSMAALSRLWRRRDPARWLAAFDFSVATLLPPEYRGIVDLYRDSKSSGDDRAAQKALAERIDRCEGRAMEAYVRGLSCFFRSPERYPHARKLRLEFFVTPPEHGVGGMASCLSSVTRWSGVEHLIVDAVPRAAAETKHKQRARLFPDKPLDARELAAPAPRSRLATLHVKNFVLTPSGRGYGAFPALSRLTLEFTPRVVVFKTGYFDNLLRACQQLVSLRLRSCDLSSDSISMPFQVDLPPASMLRELVMEACNYRDVQLVNARNLERLVVERCNLIDLISVRSAPRLETLICRGAAPRLYCDGTASLRFVELSVQDPRKGEHRLTSFLKGIPNVEELSLCFRGRRIWVLPKHFSNWLHNLKKLQIDLPRMWPLHWIQHLLEVAACMEKLHIHIFAPSSEASELLEATAGEEIAVTFQHTYLKEIEMVGFEGTGQQMELIRFVMSSCRALRTVFLIRHHALLEENLDCMGSVACPSWLMEDEKAAIVAQLRDGIQSDAEIVLG